MKKDKSNLIYVIIFIAIISLPLIQMATGIFKLPKLNEKRDKATKPVFSLKNFDSNYIKNFENYFNDNYGFRDQFIMFNNSIDVKLLKVNTNPNVIIGKNDYLYSIEELNDYNRDNTLSDADIETIGKNLLKFQKDLQERGIYFLFTIAPNKSTIYPEYMPFQPKFQNEASNYDKLQKKIDELGINNINFKKTLMENKDKYNLYYKRDTHWNDRGSFLATEEILKNLSKVYPISDMPKIKFVEKEIYNGDLDGLLGLKSWIEEEKLNIDYGDTSKKLPKTVCYLDSFSYNVLPKLNAYSSNRIDNHNISADIHSNLPYHIRNTKIIYFEMVERYIPKLLHYDFDIFDNSLDEMPKNFHFQELSLPLEQSENKDIPMTFNFVERGINKDKSHYIASQWEDSYIIWDIPKQNIDYIYIDLSAPPRDIFPMQIFWAGEDYGFNEEKSIRFAVSPLKTKYLIDVRKLKLKDIKRFRLDLGEESNVELDVRNIKLFFEKETN